MYVEIFFSSNRAAKREEQEVGTVFKQEREKKEKGHRYSVHSSGLVKKQ
jgi:hypothetical protein